MPKLDGRRRWRVQFPNGEAMWLRQLKSVRRAVSDTVDAARRSTLTRLSAGRYYSVVTWSTPGGLMAGVVMVTRMTAARAERELVNESLPFDQAAALDAVTKAIDGV